MQDWAELLTRLDDELSPAAKQQAACEVIFLTHNAGLHEVNLGWHPQAEQVLWRPDLQEAKISQNGQLNVRYDRATKARGVASLKALISQHTPWLRIRYAF